MQSLSAQLPLSILATSVADIMNKRFSNYCTRLSALAILLAWAATSLVAQAGISAVFQPASTGANDYLYFDLACNSGPFSGYFVPERWERSEDHALEITTRVGDANKGEMTGIIFSGPRYEVESWGIEIPAAGYLSFCLLPAPTQEDETVIIYINEEKVHFHVRADGLYYSPFLQKGDRFRLSIPPGKEIFHWSKLIFHSNFNAVIVRPRATTTASRYVPIQEGKIQRVFFPSEDPGAWPVFDEDGDRFTTFDQIELRTSNEAFFVEYLDKQVLRDDEYVLQRTFTIREKCRRANSLQRSREWAPLPLIVVRGGK